MSIWPNSAVRSSIGGDYHTPLGPMPSYRGPGPPGGGVVPNQTLDWRHSAWTHSGRGTTDVAVFTARRAAASARSASSRV